MSDPYRATRRNALIMLMSGLTAGRSAAAHILSGGSRATVTELPSARAASRGIAEPGAEVLVSAFGAAGDGVTDDTAAIAAAIAHALADPVAILRFDQAKYHVGSAARTGESLFTLKGASGFRMRGRPTFRITDTNRRQITLFDIQMSHVDMEYVEATGDPWTVGTVQRALSTGGIIACMVRSPSGALLSDHTFGTIRVTNGLHALLYDANDKAYGRSAYVKVGLIDVRNCLYAFNGANAPDHHEIDHIIADNVFRAYFVYGLENGKASISVKPAYSGIFAGGTCANITVYTETSPGAAAKRVGDTRNIDVTIRNTSNRPSLQLTTISMSAADNRQGHYGIRADVISATGSALKVANANLATGLDDTSTPYASPKRDIAVRAQLLQSYGCLDSNAYGVWSGGHALTLECSNFLDCALAVRQAYLRSGWKVHDQAYGYDSSSRQRTWHLLRPRS